jgi:hypothetical protein
MQISSLKKISLALFMCLSLLPSLASAATKAKKHVQKLEIPSDKSLGFLLASRDETIGNVKRIGIMPIILPEQFESRAELKASIEMAIAKKLTDAGYEVVTHEAYSLAYDNLNKKLGGIYDPDTGEYKAEQDQAIKSAARRDFIDKEHLNALLVATVRLEKASFYGSDAYLDGAVECSLGKMPPNAVAEFFLGNPSLSGTLSGYSLLVQLTNTQSKVVYGRFGGIQLANYYDPASTRGVSGFLLVPVDQSLRDNQRIERGVAIATLPLVKTPEEIARNVRNKNLNPELIKADDLPSPPQGFARKTESPLLVPRDNILASTKKIIIFPVSSKKIVATAEVKERFLALIEKELVSPTWEVVRGPDIFEAMDKEIENTKGLYNPLTGKYDEDRVVAIRKHALASLKLDSSTAVLYPTIIRSSASYKGENAHWHGVSQNIYTLEPFKKRGLFDSPSGNAEGSVASSTLITQLRDSEDKILYQGVGGIELIEQLKGGKASELAPAELFNKTEREQSAVHVALRSLLKTEAAIDTELHPNRKKAKTKKDKKLKANREKEDSEKVNQEKDDNEENENAEENAKEEIPKEN